MPQVITANRLRDGAVVFVGPGSGWVEQIDAAELFATQESVAVAIAATKIDEENNLVLDVYAIDVTEKDGSVLPVRLREAIRASGPTIHPEHGKAAQAGRG